MLEAQNKDSKMEQYIGTILPGYCNGAFGRTYTSKKIEALGNDWIVARDEDGVFLAEFRDSEHMKRSLDEWLKVEWNLAGRW